MPTIARTRLSRALRSETVGGVLLLVATGVAVGWANSPWADGYQAVRDLTFGPETLHLRLPLSSWVSDGLLAVFFFTVGNELKQELTIGRLRDPRRAGVPIVAAATGAVLPAAIFALINLSDARAAAGWGIPMATDIAFAVAVLALVGRRLPPALRTFLLTLAVVDDLIAILVIAVFYTAALSAAPLLAAVALLMVFGWSQRSPTAYRLLGNRRILRWIVFTPLTVIIWGLVHAGGVHATIAAVAMGLLMRTRVRGSETVPPSHRWEARLRPWSTGVALPVFALTSAGVSLSGVVDVFGDPIALGIVVGLLVGKVVGISGGAWLLTRLTSAHIDSSLRWPDIVGMSLVAGIGFTVSLLISELSYPDGSGELAVAKTAVLMASLLAALLGSVWLWWCDRARRSETIG